MTNEFVTFGTPDIFEIAIRAHRQHGAAIDRPAGYGWSLGDLRITIGRRVITQNLSYGQQRDFTTWYLLPIFEWIAWNWIDLLHEEDFGWNESSSAVAAVVVPSVLAETTGKDDGSATRRYEQAQAWRDRHGLRAASNGGLLPDLYIRRFLDAVELSWTDAPALFAPEGFRFVSRAGYASCSVADVATPLWDALDEFTSGVIGYPTLAVDQARFEALSAHMRDVQRSTVVDFARARISSGVLQAALSHLGERTEAMLESERVSGGTPAIAAFSPAVAMYGGINPEIGAIDVARLSDVAIQASGGGERPELAALVRDEGGIPRRAPYLEGYRLAEDLLEDLVGDLPCEAIDIRRLVEDLGIVVVELSLETDTIRGVGLAGSGMSPTIVLNRTSSFNITPEGRRFTLAHELCHILYDRGHARRVGITSGPWAPAAVERRANAFAAGIMMPRAMVFSAFEGERFTDSESIVVAAERLQVSYRALVEHLYNLHLINEAERERLRGVKFN